MINNKSVAGRLALLLASLAFIFSLVGNFKAQKVEAQLEGVTHRAGLQLKQSTFGTATPQFEIYNQSTNGNQSLVIRDSGGTPEVVVDSDGGVTINDLTFTGGGNTDLNGNSLIIDADADTSLTADTDDQIDFAIGGSDIYSMTATTLAVNGKVLDLDVDNDTSITADTDDQIDFEVGGTDSLTLTTTALVIEALGFTETANTTSGTQTVTPTTSVVSFAPTTVTTVTLGTPSGNIKLLMVYNKNTTDTVIVDTGATAGGGSITIAQNDPVWFYWTGSLWMELLSPDNS